MPQSYADIPANQTKLPSGRDLDFAFDFHRDVEGKLGHSDRASRVRTLLASEDLDDELRESVDDRGLAIESRSGIDHAEDARPGGDAIEVAQLALEASEDR